MPVPAPPPVVHQIEGRFPAPIVVERSPRDLSSHQTELVVIDTDSIEAEMPEITFPSQLIAKLSRAYCTI